MQLHELNRRTREWLLDDISNNPDQSDDEYRWSDSEINEYLAEAQDEACRRSDLLYEEDDDTTTLITLAADTFRYDISSNLTKVTEVIFDDMSLERTTLERKTRTGKAWRKTTSSQPFEWALNGRVLTLYPAPDTTNAALECRVVGYRLPLNRLSVVNNTPEIDTHLHPFLCYYAAHLAYLKRDEDTYNPGRADEMESRFAQHFGPRYRADVMSGLLEAGDDITVRTE